MKTDLGLTMKLDEALGKIFKVYAMNISICRPVKTPTRGTSYSAGLDFYVPDDFQPVSLKKGEAVNIPSGIKADIPDGYALVAFNKSGVALRGLSVGACVVDSDYQGEIHLHVINIASDEIAIKPGDKLVQFLLLPVALPVVKVIPEEELFGETTLRGDGGFGSTGTR